MRIAVITPAWNAAPTITDAIRSVLAQSHQELRLVVIDDGSTDSTAALAARFTDPRLRLIRQHNAGVSAARNRGMAEADGDALLFLDADDWLTPDALATLAATLQAAPRAVAAVGGYVSPPASPVAPPQPGDLLTRLLVRNLFINGGHLLIRQEAARAAGRFHPGLIYGEDWEYWIRLALQGEFTSLARREPVLFVRSRAEGAYRRLAADPHAFGPCMTAIFGNPALAARLRTARLAALRRRAEAENAWIVGREQIRHGRRAEGRRWLRRAVTTAPAPRRLALLAAAHALAVLPARWHGPFRIYEGNDDGGYGEAVW